MVLGPSRRNHKKFLPPDAFIHISDFQSPKELAQYLLPLDKDHTLYLGYFCSRETLRPPSFSRALMFCKAAGGCRRIPPTRRCPAQPPGSRELASLGCGLLQTHLLGTSLPGWWLTDCWGAH